MKSSTAPLTCTAGARFTFPSLALPYQAWRLRDDTWFAGAAALSFLLPAFSATRLNGMILPHGRHASDTWPLASGRKQPSTVGSQNRTSVIRKRSPRTRTRPRGRTLLAASRGSTPTGTPTEWGRNRTKPLGVSCAPAGNQRASEDDRSAPGDVPAGHGGRRDRGRCQCTRRSLAEVARCQACQWGWMQLRLM